jgi:rRNA maturation RNase YbeY
MRTSIAMPPGKPVLNRTKALKLLEFMLNKANGSSGREWGDVSVVVTNDHGIQEVNGLHLGHHDTTDVITYTYEALPGEQPVEASGELFVNIEMARRMGKRFGGTARELALYIAHGCDHLAGENDRTPDQRRRMRRRELRWLAEASRLKLLTGLILS